MRLHSATHALFLVLLLVVTTICPHLVHAHVIGVDFGSEYIKVAGPHADQSIDIVLNELSRRKTDNFVGFRHGERYIGEQARTLAARFPALTASAINQLIGIQANTPQATDFARLQYDFNIDYSNRSSVIVSAGGPDAPMSAEELYAIVLGYLRKISILDGIPTPNNFVVTIPFSSTPEERKAILDASQLANMHPLGYMHSTTAAAFYYGMRRRGFGNNTVSILIIDVGSTHTEAGVYTFSPSTTPRKITSKLGVITTQTVVEDRHLGGRHLDLCVARIIEKEAVAKLGIDSILDKHGESNFKAHFSLLRAAQKIRETLSANSATPYTVEGISADKDFSSVFTRATFEAECGHILSRARVLVQDAIKASGIDRAGIQAFELMGGAARTPKLIADISEEIGRDADRTLNMDEAAAIGAGYYGVKLSPSYNTNSFDVHERVPFDAFISIEPPFPGADEKHSRLQLFDRSSFIGDSFSITVNRTDDFSLKLFTNNDDDATPFAEIDVHDVKEQLDSLNFFTPKVVHPNNSHLIRLQFTANDLGLLEVSEATVVVRYAANVSSKVHKTPSDADNNKEESDGSNTEIIYNIRMRHRNLPLRTTMRYVSLRDLSHDERQASISKLAKQDAHENYIRRRGEAKNSLEGFLYFMKGEGLLDSEEELGKLEPSSVERIRNALTEATEWLDYGEGAHDSCTEEQFTTVHTNLKNLIADAMRVATPEPTEEAADL